MAVDKEKQVPGNEFCKKFTMGTGWQLPDPNDMFTESQWQLKEFQNLKTVLNYTKQKLNCFDLDEWHAHTTKLNPAGLVINHVRKHIRPDFLTQAWCKFYEIACSSSLFSQDVIDKNNVFSVHLCEAPGAFISSLNHYIANNYKHLRLKWLAMTLNPYHEANGHPDIINDDRLILNTLDNWEFGPDYTGDIFQAEYSEHLYQMVHERFDGNVFLVTADGSIDCSDNPGEQENVVMRLHHYECMVALNVLHDNGSLVLKMFTTFECDTICRTYLLCCLFKSVVLMKPVTSKPGNSEVYAVCTGYKGRLLALPFIQKFFLNDRQNNTSAIAAMFPLSQIPREFRNLLLECSKYFSNMQIQIIQNNIDALSDKQRCYRKMETLQWSVCQNFITRYNLKPIRYNQELMSANFKSRIRINCRLPSLSYSEKIRLQNLDLEQEADMLYKEIMTFDEWKKPRLHDVFWGNCKHLSISLSDIQFRLGKPVTVVKGSKFCNQSLINYRLRVLLKFPQVKNKMDTDSRSLYYRIKLDRPDMSVCDLTDICIENSADNVAQQYYCLKSMIATLRKQTMGDFLLIGYPLYTQMSVACFFAVASMFKTYGLLRPDYEYGHAFVFVGYEKHDGWLNALDKAKDYLLSEVNKDMALVSWIPIKVLLEQNAYSDIVSVNNLCIIHEIEPILSNFLNSVS